MNNNPWQILLIEDNADDRADLRRMLLCGSDRRYRFTEAELGAEGLRQAREKPDGPFDCVLLDYYLPDMNGDEVLAALCDGEDLPPCPVVLVTGSVREDGAKLLRAGAQDYIGKNWMTPEGLTRVVENAIERYKLLTERKQTDEALRAKEERLRLALDAGAMATWDWNIASGAVNWNDRLYELLGYDLGTVSASYEAWARRVYPEDLQRVEVLIQESMKKGSDYRAEYRVLGRNDAILWIEARGRFELDNQTKNLRSYGVIQDITERKRTEAELINAMLLADQANRAKSDFLSRMSHELRSPLNAILGFAQLLESGLPQPIPDQMACIDQILQAGWYLLALINEILDLASIESGKLSLSPEPASLNDVLSDCQNMIEPQAQKCGVSMSFFLLDSTCLVKADRTRLKQVFINLLSNAIKYNREQGTVEVKCTAVNLERIRISIKDSGMGLPPEKMAHLFEPFNRLGQQTSSTHEGTGIGLAVTKQLVELMGGTIGVECTVGAGCEFWVELIRDNIPNLAVEKTMPTELASQTKKNAPLSTLLYVEDNPASLTLIEQIIRNYPHLRMLSTSDGNLGIALARAHLPDLILMDINLPGISGIEALKILREDPATAHIRVVAISANAMPHDIEKGLGAGFFRYLTKPIKINEFMHTLDEALILSERAQNT
jgi:PAS domain S-box-containing protein